MRHRSIVRGLLALGLIVLTACGTGAAPTAVPTSTPLETSIQLSWLHSIEFAGIYAINHQNIGSQARMTLRIDGGGFDDKGQYIDPVAQVVSGQADFGVAGADIILRARSEGMPVVAIATVYQRSPVALISLKSANIQRPQDLAGKRIGIAPPGTTVYVSYQALLKAETIDTSGINEIAVLPENAVQDLFDNKIDALHAFITHEATQARAQRDDINVLLLSDYGIDLYSNVVFTTEKMIAENPAAVETFVKALSQGLQWSIDHPQEAAKQVVSDYGATMPPQLQALQEAGMLASVPLIKPAGSQTAMMSAKVWENTQQILLDQQLIAAPIDVTKAYDLSFINRAYGQ